MALPPPLDKNKNHPFMGVSKPLLIRIAIAMLLAFAISQFELDYLEGYLYDLRVRIRPNPETSHKIEIVTINSDTIQQLKGHPNAKIQRQVLEKILDKKPKFVFYDFDITKVTGTEAEKNEWNSLALKHTNIYVGTEALEMRGEEGKLNLQSPLNGFKLISAPKSQDIYNFSKDSVSRRVLLNYHNSPLLHPFFASAYNPDIGNIKNIRGRFELLETDQTYIDFHPKGSFPLFNLSEILENHAPESFKDKIILIGQDLELEPEEYVTTPFNRKATAMTRSELHANAIDSLIRNAGPMRPPEWLNSCLILLISLLTINVIMVMRPTKGLSIIGLIAISFILISFFAYYPFGIWIKMAPPLLAIFLSYYFCIPYRLIKENRRSWEYYQRHKLLSQVEELKSNFISMISHDFKTPIARIQGMIEVIQKNSNPLSPPQVEAIKTIRLSNDELLKFINAILQYGKIESQQVQLNIQNKDINTILSEVIKKYDFLAHAKKITIETKLEPLFSIPVDPDLISLVFSNLIENAIKYSYEDGKILISTDERNDFVIISVTDHGPGIELADIPHIFSKFYRSKNAKVSTVKGSGLGLYLAKYFTELHYGRVFVESSYGKGSKFTVELPVMQRRPNA